MNRERVVGMILYGDVKDEKNSWKKWISYAKSISLEMNCKLTHFAIVCDGMDGELKTLSRSEKKLLAIINSDKRVDSISFSALKKGFTSMLDDEICLILDSKNKPELFMPTALIGPNARLLLCFGTCCIFT